jgi:hypothetical protein
MIRMHMINVGKERRMMFVIVERNLGKLSVNDNLRKCKLACK